VRGYSLRRLREEAALAVDQDKTLSRSLAAWWPQLRNLFRAIATGDASLGLPPYNCGLFQNAPEDLLLRVELPDAVVAPLLDAMSRELRPG
jgi:hypothetical protein